jgi:hypothetical protein
MAAVVLAMVCPLEIAVLAGIDLWGCCCAHRYIMSAWLLEYRFALTATPASNLLSQSASVRYELRAAFFFFNTSFI